MKTALAQRNQNPPFWDVGVVVNGVVLSKLGSTPTDANFTNTGTTWKALGTTVGGFGVDILLGDKLGAVANNPFTELPRDAALDAFAMFGRLYIKIGGSSIVDGEPFGLYRTARGSLAGGNDGSRAAIRRLSPESTFTLGQGQDIKVYAEISNDDLLAVFNASAFAAFRVTMDPVDNYYAVA